MNEHLKTFAVVNLRSANGRTEKLWPDIERALSVAIGDLEFAFTTGRYTAPDITKKAIKSGFNRIIAVGGDGTLNEVLNGFFENDKPINRQAVLGVISMGTGADFIKTMGIPKPYRDAVKVIKNAKTMDMDTGKIKFVSHDGHETIRYFINIADAGIGGETVDRVNRTTKVFGGFISFLWGTIMTLITYKNKNITITLDNNKPYNTEISMLAIANCQFFGGGMHIAPKAVPDDGMFDIVTIGKAGFIDFIRNSSKIYKGTHINGPMVGYTHAIRVELTSKDRVLLDVDGEQPGMLPATFDILPKSINVIVP
ncbi:MAG: diacylglycerol kinase family lipid kinase [Deltaproteobacteria bacterium]|nr:diacylglycerol kinase family lipid kinase [Deltaproteobacteria bacterium]MCL5793135.1 diacylglycerol kinase family lipid kinase [Deltaproteobacteria bacterium]